MGKKFECLKYFEVFCFVTVCWTRDHYMGLGNIFVNDLSVSVTAFSQLNKTTWVFKEHYMRLISQKYVPLVHIDFMFSSFWRNTRYPPYCSFMNILLNRSNWVTSKKWMIENYEICCINIRTWKKKTKRVQLLLKVYHTRNQVAIWNCFGGIYKSSFLVLYLWKYGYTTKRLRTEHF